MIGLNVLRNTYMLFNYGALDDPASAAPYVQVLSVSHIELRDYTAVDDNCDYTDHGCGGGFEGF